MVLTSAAVLIALMNYCAPMTALPQTAAGLNAGPTAQTWILNGVVLGLATVLLTTGSLADDYGRKRVFVIGAGLFAVAGALATFAPGVVPFVVARVIQGAASAAMLTTSLGIIGHTFPAGPVRARATALWGAMLGLGICLGPLVSGGLTEVWHWRAAYGVFAVASLALTVCAAVLLPESRAAVPRKPDLLGAGTLAIGLAALLAALSEGRLGWDRPRIAVLFAVAAIALASFVLAERRVRQPMLDFGLFRQPAFALSIVGALVVGLSVIGLMSYLPTMLQRTNGIGPFASAGAFAIWSGTAFVVALRSGRWRVPPRRLLAAGLALSAIGQLTLWGLADAWSWPRVVVALVIAGVGSGLGNAALAGLAIGSVPADRASMGSGANQTARYIGASVGVAGMVGIVAAAAGPTHDLALGMNVAIIVAASLALAGALFAVLLRPGTELG